MTRFPTIIPALSIVLLLLTTMAAYGSTYGEIHDDAYGESSDVLDSYLVAAENLDADSVETNLPVIGDYSELMASFEEASRRDPMTALLERYPIADKATIDELATLSTDEVTQRLARDIDEQLILVILVARSPRLARAEHAWRAALNRYPQTVYLQDLLTQYQAFTEGMSLGVGQEYQRGMIQMNYSSPGMLTLRGRVVELDIEIAWNEYLQEGSDVIADAKSILAEIKNKNDLISINSRSVSRLSVLSGVSLAQYVSGTRSFSDLVRIRTELASRNDSLERIRSMRDGLTGRLASMLNLPTSTSFGNFTRIDADPDLPESEILMAGLVETRPELIGIGLGIEKMDAMIEMALLRADPDRTFGFTYFQGRDVASLSGSGDMDGMDDMNMAGDADSGEMEMDDMSFMNSPMIDFRNTGFAPDLTWAMEMFDRRDAMTEMLNAKNDMASGMLQMQIERYNRSIESAGVSGGRIIPNAQAALDVVRSGYTTDENNFNDLIMAELSLLMARMDLANFRMEAHLAVAEIEQLIGHALIDSE